MTDGNRREAPDVIVTAVAMLDDAHAVRHDDAEVLAGRASGNDLRIVAGRKFHRNAERNNFEVQRLQNDVLGGVKVNPLAM